MVGWDLYLSLAVVIIIVIGVIIFLVFLNKKREKEDYVRGLKLVPLLIHLPPSTDDIQGGGRDERDVANEAISQAQVMYAIVASTFEKGFRNRFLGQDHISFEIIATNGLIKYYTLVPYDKVEVVKQAINSAYPSARIEKVERENIFSKESGINGVAGGELKLKKEYIYPINTYEETKRDASLAILGAMSAAKEGEGLAVQILIRPVGDDWTKNSLSRVQNLKEGGGVEKKTFTNGNIIRDIIVAPFRVPEMHEKTEYEVGKPLTNLQQEEIVAIENKTKYPAFEVLIRIVASSSSRARSEAMMSGVVTAFSQFDSPVYNGFRIDSLKDPSKLAKDYIFRSFPLKERTNILNSVELASIFHLPEQNAIPSSQVERQLTKQVDGPAKLANEGILLGVNEFRGEQKKIYLDDDNRRRHLYMIGQTGSGKSVFLENIAFQDMCDGRGFAFIDPHGDAVEALLKRVPQERIDDVVYFDPADIEHPVGMNMFEFNNPDQKDFIVQEGINMLYSLFDPGHTGIFGPRGEHMFRNAALLLMSDPNGATFIDIPQCFIDPEFVKSKLKYVTDKAVYDYWTKEFPASQRSNDAGEVTTWFVSKWGPFLSNTIMRNILGQAKSGFNIREIMDQKKIFLVNLSKGRLGDLNSQLLGMIFVMKFQQAAMSRADIPEDERKDFCLYVDEFQNFATDSFESILSEARKYRLNLIVANQFMTQLTDKIREAILGNVGTILCGRVGVTDAELMAKAFTPTFTAEDLTKQANYSTICKVMMFGMPSAPFTMKFLPPMGEPNDKLMETLKVYTATKYGRTRAEVEREINSRWNTKKGENTAKKDSQEAVGGSETSVTEKDESDTDSGQKTPQKAPEAVKKDFLGAWMKKKQEVSKNSDISQERQMKPEDTVQKQEEKVVEEKKKEEVPQEGFIRIR